MVHKRKTSGFPVVRCSVDGCMRGTSRIEPVTGNQIWLNTGTADPGWICGGHWPRVPRSYKRRMTLFRRRLRKLWPDGAAEPVGDAMRDYERVWALYRRMWQRCVEAAAGPRDMTIEEIERIFGVL